MRRPIYWMLALVVLLSGAAAAADPRVVVDGRALALDVPPVIEDGRTLVPLRPIFNALGAAVDWNETTKTATASRAGITIKLTIGQPVAYRNGVPVSLAVPAKVINDRTMVPLRFVSEALGAQVGWDDATQTASIISVKQPATPPPVTAAPTTNSSLGTPIKGLWCQPGSPQLPADPAQAVINDQIVDGEWYLFRDDGTYLYVWMGSNPLLSGAAETRGRYRIEGSTLILIENMESWYPSSGWELDYPSFTNEPAKDESIPVVLNADGSLLLGETSYVQASQGPTQPQKPPANGNSLVGFWSSEGAQGTMVDPLTGTMTGLYNVDWYLFREDGTYRYLMMGAGQFISGTVNWEGKYRIDGQKVVLYDNLVDWIPSPTHIGSQQPAYQDRSFDPKTLEFSFRDEGKSVKIGDYLYYRGRQEGN